MYLQHDLKKSLDTANQSSMASLRLGRHSAVLL